MFVSATRFRLKSLKFLPGIMWHNIQTRKQIINEKNCQQFKLRIQPKGLRWVFWTLTLWPNQQAALNFRNSGAHLAVMPHLREVSDEASYAHWETDEPTLPDWAAAEEQLKVNGKLSLVNHPSAAHANGQTVPV